MALDHAFESEAVRKPVAFLEKNELTQLTKFTFDKKGWEAMLPSEPYDPEKVFFGSPKKKGDPRIKTTTADGAISFEDVYDEKGKRLGGSIFGYPKEKIRAGDEGSRIEGFSEPETMTKTQRLEKLEKIIEKLLRILKEKGIEINEEDLLS